ncbi:hypothetical protein AAMO2058_000411300 [Amorphochlora amoebiformis]
MTVALLSAAFLGACLADPNPRVPNYLGALEPEDAAWLDSLESLDENKDLPPLPTPLTQSAPIDLLPPKTTALPLSKGSIALSHHMGDKSGEIPGLDLSGMKESLGVKEKPSKPASAFHHGGKEGVYEGITLNAKWALENMNKAINSMNKQAVKSSKKSEESREKVEKMDKSNKAAEQTDAESTAAERIAEATKKLSTKKHESSENSKTFHTEKKQGSSENSKKSEGSSENSKKSEDSLENSKKSEETSGDSSLPAGSGGRGGSNWAGSRGVNQGGNFNSTRAKRTPGPSCGSFKGASGCCAKTFCKWCPMKNTCMDERSNECGKHFVGCNQMDSMSETRQWVEASMTSPLAEASGVLDEVEIPDSTSRLVPQYPTRATDYAPPHSD